MGVIYISPRKLSELLKEPLFIAYAPGGGKTIGGELNGRFYMVRKNV